MTQCKVNHGKAVTAEPPKKSVSDYFGFGIAMLALVVGLASLTKGK